MSTPVIPVITDERLAELAARIRPLFSVDGKLHWMKQPDLRRTAFTWSPEEAGTAAQLEVLATIRTYHTYGFYGFFKPTIAEVIAQIPERYLPGTVAFLTNGPRNTDDLNKEKELLNAGFHVATTTLYRRAAFRPKRGPVFSERELATVLAALRKVQRSADTLESDFPDHFNGFAPLNADEIETLCQQLNHP